jgi:hypothetical protein
MASNENKALKCAYKPCKNKFVPRTHNQKYCSDECCKIATNIKIKEKYEYKKARKSGKPFKCETKGCSSILNRYTTDKICGKCQSAKIKQDHKDLLDMLNGN